MLRFIGTYGVRQLIDQKLMKQELIQERIHNLRCSDYPKERIKALEKLRSNFLSLPDKEMAGNDLHKLIKDDNSDVRRFATLVLSELFYCIQDQQQAWNDLHKRTRDIDNDVKWVAAFAIGIVFSKIPDQQQAWGDLHRLTYDENNNIRGMAAKSLRSAFSHVSDKESVWSDLHRLTYDEDNSVRGVAAVTLGSSYSHIPNKEMALKDLYRLANDEDRVIRSETYRSLGKVFIFNASQTEREEDYRKELEKAIEFFEKAIEFFEKASTESVFLSPSRFCLPFYRSFHTILFKKQEAKEEVDKYLAEAKDAIEGSKSKELLFEAVNNLANALKQVQNVENLDLEAMKNELSFYRKYCDRASELMKDAEEITPFATIALRKGLPILDRNLKEFLEEIQKKTEIISEQTKGTQFEELGNELNQNSQFLLQVRHVNGGE